jgi:hypothetical protein
MGIQLVQMDTIIPQASLLHEPGQIVTVYRLQTVWCTRLHSSRQGTMMQNYDMAQTETPICPSYITYATAVIVANDADGPTFLSHIFKEILQLSARGRGLD